MRKKGISTLHFSKPSWSREAKSILFGCSSSGVFVNLIKFLFAFEKRIFLAFLVLDREFFEISPHKLYHIIQGFTIKLLTVHSGLIQLIQLIIQCETSSGSFFVVDCVQSQKNFLVHGALVHWIGLAVLPVVPSKNHSGQGVSPPNWSRGLLNFFLDWRPHGFLACFPVLEVFLDNGIEKGDCLFQAQIKTNNQKQNKVEP